MERMVQNITGSNSFKGKTVIPPMDLSDRSRIRQSGKAFISSPATPPRRGLGTGIVSKPLL